MRKPYQPAIRNCPLCGVAMQASKSRDELAAFEIFQCQSCQTTITATPQQPTDGEVS